MNIAQAKCIPIANYLAKQGHEPKKTRLSGRELWYQSPIRSDDENPSFKVDTTKNVWYDHGLVKGGSIIDLVIELCACDVRDALRHLDGMHLHSSVLPKPQTDNVSPGRVKNDDNEKQITAGEKKKNGPLELISTSPLTHPALLQYLSLRKIDHGIARKYLSQIDFKRPESDGTYFGIGYPAGDGFELRNALFKGFVGTGKNVTYHGKENASVIKVFEGFMDFLSYLSSGATLDDNHAYIVLNSTNIWRRAVSYLEAESCKEVRLYLDNDEAGDAATKHFMQSMRSNQTVTDMRSHYAGFEDLNAWHTNDRN